MTDIGAVLAARKDGQPDLVAENLRLWAEVAVLKEKLAVEAERRWEGNRIATQEHWAEMDRARADIARLRGHLIYIKNSDGSLAGSLADYCAKALDAGPG